MAVALQRLRRADDLRKSECWKDALSEYLAVEKMQPDDAGVKSNVALCLLGLREAEKAIAYCEQAVRLDSKLWSALVIKAKALRMTGDADAAVLLLANIMKHCPENPDARLELASVALDELGDAALARKLVQPLMAVPAYANSATLTMLMTRLYDREESAEALTKAICEFSAHALTLPRITASRRRAPGTGPLRVGFLSPAFCSSPVYFFCIGAMKHLAKEIDIVILSRGHRRDWATREFATIARHWHDVSRLGAAELAKFIADQALDVLVDQGGWMDVVALKAISAKPAARIYKWVGGQSVTTGIRAFDGFISDAYQTPANHQRFYVEPLVLMPDGYVTYTAPPYMPSPIPAEKGRLSVGVIANPAKVSRAFLADLEVRMNNLSEHTGEVGKIRFIDRRYRHQALRTRLLKSLGGLANASARRRIGIEFIAPDSHLAYLSEVARLTAVIDTYPYSGGLTTVEALSLGVPCWTTSGDLFCERHSYAHCAYATDLASEMTVIPGTARQNLYDDASLRHQHRRLANGLLALFKSGNHSVI